MATSLQGRARANKGNVLNHILEKNIYTAIAIPGRALDTPCEQGNKQPLLEGGYLEVCASSHRSHSILTPAHAPCLPAPSFAQPSRTLLA
jgi:hypothetical protein